MDVLRLTLRQLQIFVAVARHGSTTAAGADIALSQSATSSAVNELERLLSLQLFDRAGKRLLLNENGRALLPRALALLDAAAEVEHFARNGRDQIQSLRIGASSTIGNYLLPGLLGKFLGEDHRRATSDWKSAVAIGNTAAICEAVAAFELDVGLIEGPCHESALQVTPWVHDEMLIVAATGSPLADAGDQDPAPLAALRDAMWLLRESGSGTREATDQVLLPHLLAYRRSIELGSSEAIKRAAAEGVGIACLSRWVVKDFIDAGRLCAVRTSLPIMMRQCHVVTHRDKQMTPVLRQFLAQLLPDAA
jgi:DNA-binding transcriptional LysR family regulator